MRTGLRNERYENAEMFMFDEILEAIRDFSKGNGFYDIAKKAQNLLDKYGFECQKRGYLFFNKSELEKYVPKYLWKYFREEPFSYKEDEEYSWFSEKYGWLSGM